MTEVKVFVLLCIFGSIFCREIYAQRTNFFRKDYTFLEDTNSFYKIHTIAKAWAEAKKQCSTEGATLFYPDNEYEAETVLSFWNRTQPYYYAFVGISDSVVKGVFETIDGLSINEVYNKWAPGEPNDAGGVEGCVVLSRLDSGLNDDQCSKKYHFICKKTKSSLVWNTACDLPDPGYKYNASLDKCYKFHNPANWETAYAICRTELSYLAVINSKPEAEYLAKLVEQSPKPNFGSQYSPGAVYLGFHNRGGDGWKTVIGKSLEDSGYTEWGGGQPDGGENEKCGSMFYNGQLNDMNCDRNCFFICEHDLSGGADLLDSRFGNN